jgi:hypothetical protein
VLDDAAYRELLAIRATRPTEIAERWQQRRRRPLLSPDGTLFLLAADHPARGMLAAGSQGRAMADRRDLLARLMTGLAVPGVDGVLATADVLEDLLVLGGLEGKVAFGSMNRGGLAGAVFELDDRVTGYSPEAIADYGLDGGKLLLRMDPADPGTLATLEYCAHAVACLATRGLTVMIEPFAALRDGGGQLRHDLRAGPMARVLAVAAGLGPTSAYTWLKVPVIPDMAGMLAATTLPCVLLGGDPGDAGGLGELWPDALAHPQVRGVVVGRSVLYPADGDVEGAVERLAGLLEKAGRQIP